MKRVRDFPSSDNGQLSMHEFSMREFYRDGKLEGESKLWHDNGELWERAFFRGGKNICRFDLRCKMSLLHFKHRLRLRARARYEVAFALILPVDLAWLLAQFII